MKKKKSLLIALILIAIISITTSVNAATWGGQTTPGSTVNGTRTVTGATLSLTFGEVDGSGNLITRVNIPLSSDENQAGTIKAGCPANHYTMSLDNADSNGVVTGLDSTQTQNGNEKLIVNALKTGTQTIHIVTRRTSDDWPAGVEAYDNIVNVISYYSTNFQNAASALDITFNGNNTVYYSDNINIYPEDNSKFEAILNAKSKYEALNSYEKQRLDSIISSASNGTYSNYTALYNAADNYLTSLARTFITSTSVNGLKGNTVANKDNCEIIINAQTEYDNLKDIVKNRVNLILTSDPSSVYGGYSSVNYPTLLVQAKAYKFIKTYSIDTPDGNLSKLNDEKILDSEINADYKWDDLESDVKAQVNAFLNTAVGRNYASQMSFVRNHLEQTLADSFVDNTFFSEYEELAGTKSLRNYNKNTELNQEITDEYENLARKITGDVDTEYNSITSNQYVNETSLKQKIDNEIANTNYMPILEAAQDYLADLEEARNFVADHKLNDELTAEIAEDVITLDNAVDGRVKDIVEVLIDKTMTEKIQEADDYLTEEDGKVIGQVNNSNYKKVIKAAEPYEALSEEVKAIVNSKLKASVNTTYPELLSAAQSIEKSPKTGDTSGIMIGVLIVSVIGIVAVIKKRK